MTGARIRLIVAAILFLGWIGWLALAVIVHRTNPPEVVSRSQLTDAVWIVVADVTLGDDGLPDSKVSVVSTVSSREIEPTPTAFVHGLKAAQTPTAQPLASGRYLLPLVPSFKEAGNERAWEIAGWPRSPSVPARKPDQELDSGIRVRRPVVYPWNDAVQKQLRSVGLGQ